MGASLSLFGAPVLGPTHFGPQHSAVRIWSSVGRFMLPPFYLKKKGRLRCHKRPKSREETPKRAAIAVWGWGDRYRMPHLRRSRSAAQLNVGKRLASKGIKEPYQGLRRLPLKPT